MRLGFLWVAAATTAVYWTALSRSFVNWDDDYLIAGNPYILSITWANLKWMFTSLYMTTYQPLGWLLYALLGGADALHIHRATLLLHAANAGLLFLFAAEATGQGSLACGLAALAWAFHPLNAESVAWATELPDVLAAFFFLLCLLAYLRGRLWAAAACFAASGLSRWKGVHLPVVLVLLDWLRFGKVRWREKIPFFAFAALLVAVNGAAKAQIAGISLLGGLLHPAKAGQALVFYLRKALLPVDLGPLYVLRESSWLPAAAFVLVTAFVLRQRGALAVSWLWYAAAILPTTALSVRGELFAQDHYAYLALAGFVLPVAAALKGRRAWACAALLPLLAHLSIRQASLWQDPVRLWTQAVCVDPRSCVALGNLRSIFIQRGRLGEAAVVVQDENRYCPDERRTPWPLAASRAALARAYLGLGRDRLDIGRTTEAAEMFSQALKLDPTLPR